MVIEVTFRFIIQHEIEHPSASNTHSSVFDRQKEGRSSDTLMDRPGREVKGHGSQVVFFSNLPREEEKKKELLTIAGRFGIVEKHLFLTDQVKRRRVPVSKNQLCLMHLYIYRLYVLSDI